MVLENGHGSLRTTRTLNLVVCALRDVTYGIKDWARINVVEGDVEPCSEG